MEVLVRSRLGRARKGLCPLHSTLQRATRFADTRRVRTRVLTPVPSKGIEEGILIKSAPCAAPCKVQRALLILEEYELVFWPL